MPLDKRLTVESQPSPKDAGFLEDRINTLNVQRTGCEDYLPLAIFVRDEDGAIKAGICGFTWGGCCEVKTLWVHEDRRGQGLGKRLLKAAEAEALARGCKLVILDTHSFQAPGFYHKLGYAVVGVVDGYPRGHQKVFLKKRLIQE